MFAALKKLEENAPETFRRLKVEFIGPVEKRFEDMLEKSSFKGNVVFSKPVSYLTSLKKMMEADALLVIDAPADVSVFLPSKVVDYLGTGKPIIGLTPEGACARLIDDMRQMRATPNDVDAIYNVLKEFITKFDQNKNGFGNYNNISKRYSSQEIADRTEIVFQKLMKGHV